MTDLLDADPVTASEIAGVEDAVARLLGVDGRGVPLDTARDVLLVQAEAIAALEAVARAVGAPGSTAINVVTGPYGALFGDWMRASGARVVDVRSELDDVTTTDAVRAALDAEPHARVLALVHAEAATGGSNPVRDVLALARERGLVTVLDAVASIGAEPVPAAWGVDITAIGPQKGLAGPAGVSAVAISERAWGLIEANPRAPRGSFLSLLDIRDGWTDAGRTAVMGTPNSLETRAFGLALARVAAEGVDAVIARHEHARAATVAGVRALGIDLWQRSDTARAGVVTTLRSTPPLRAAIGGIVSAGNGTLREDVLRVNHTGRAASPDAVTDALTRLARAADRDPRVALEAAGL